jgi:DNA replication and repair protein RecF
VRVDRLETVNFRNLDETELEIAPGVNLFVGENGQGKTNLLEAVYLFKFGRSFRTHRETELIGFDKPFFRNGSTCSYGDGYTEEFSISVDRSGRKKITVSGVDVPRRSDLIGRYPVVLFGPTDLGIVSGSPGERRRFVDIVGSMTNPVYIRLLKDYRRILNQRNAALKARASASERDAWNNELVEKGIDLTVRRRELTKQLEIHLLNHASDLDVPFDFSLDYSSTIARESAALAGNGRAAGPEEMKSVFEAKLVSLEREELRRGTTLVGPHRDDVTIGLSGKEVRKYGSQGQRRLLVILLKLSEMTFLEAESREECVLLLDDVFSEFDDPITRKLQAVLESGRQVLVTSPVSLDWAASGDVRLFTVKNGSIIL